MLLHTTTNPFRSTTLIQQNGIWRKTQTPYIYCLIFNYFEEISCKFPFIHLTYWLPLVSVKTSHGMQWVLSLVTICCQGWGFVHTKKKFFYIGVLPFLGKDISRGPCHYFVELGTKLFHDGDVTYLLDVYFNAK